MSLGKHPSVTSDTRITASLNNSLSGQQRLAKQLQQSEHCEVEFLRRKNAQLQERVSRMTAHIADLQQNKVELLNLNQKYVLVVNQYYRRAAQEQIRGENCKENQKGRENRFGNGGNLLAALEKDHRNLVKHCLNMEQEIKNYVSQMHQFNEMKRHLQAVNHTNTKELIEELRCLTDECRVLKKENNRLEYELQKSNQECSKLKKGKEEWQDRADEQSGELQKYKSLVNTVQQQSTDKSNAYQAKIYELQIKVQKLETQLRKEQSFLLRNTELKRKLQMAEVEYVHEANKMRMSMREKKKQLKLSQSNSFYQ